MNISVKRHNTGNYISEIIQVSYENDFPDWTGWKSKFQIFPLKQNREQKRYSTLCNSTNVCLQFGGPCLSITSVPNAFFIYFLGVDWWNDPYDDFNGSHRAIKVIIWLLQEKRACRLSDRGCLLWAIFFYLGGPLNISWSQGNLHVGPRGISCNMWGDTAARFQFSSVTTAVMNYFRAPAEIKWMSV